MILFPPAKINLGLKVLKKREDGYHEISTCMVQIPLCDVLELLPAKKGTFLLSGRPVAGNSQDNLVQRAWQILHDHYGISEAYIHLRKEIPMGAGLGGGSADAVFALRGFNQLFGLGLSNDVLRELAAELGSDCPFFVEDLPQMAGGRGEILEPLELDLKGYYLKLIYPEIHISTAEAYAGIRPSMDGTPVREVLSLPMERWKDHLHNDFEASVFPKHPEIEALKNALYNEGAVYASMSGSGSALFGIFREEPSSKVAGTAWCRVFRF